MPSKVGRKSMTIWSRGVLSHFGSQVAPMSAPGSGKFTHFRHCFARAWRRKGAFLEILKVETGTQTNQFARPLVTLNKVVFGCQTDYRKIAFDNKSYR